MSSTPLKLSTLICLVSGVKTIFRSEILPPVLFVMESKTDSTIGYASTGQLNSLKKESLCFLLLEAGLLSITREPALPAHLMSLI